MKLSGWLIELNRRINSSLTETVVLRTCGKSFHSLFSPIVSLPVLLPGLTGVWFLLRPCNRSQWCGTIHVEQPWQERCAIHAPGYHRVFLAGQAFVVLELAQHQSLRALVAASEKGLKRGCGRGIKLATASSSPVGSAEIIYVNFKNKRTFALLIRLLSLNPRSSVRPD